MYYVSTIEKEHDLTKIMRNSKKSKSEVTLLFVSLWDKYSEALVEQLKSKEDSTEDAKPVYVIDSFTMPHSFVIYKTTKVPHLVKISAKGNVTSEDYLPKIYEELAL